MITRGVDGSFAIEMGGGVKQGGGGRGGGAIDVLMFHGLSHGLDGGMGGFLSSLHTVPCGCLGAQGRWSDTIKERGSKGEPSYMMS